MPFIYGLHKQDLKLQSLAIKSLYLDSMAILKEISYSFVWFLLMIS